MPKEKEKEKKVLAPPVCGLVYFMDNPNKGAIRIGWGADIDRIEAHESAGMDFIAAMPGTGISSTSIEKSIQGFFDKHVVKNGTSTSFFSAKEVRPYVDALLQLNYASSNKEHAKCCPQLPWEMLNPDRVLKLKLNTLFLHTIASDERNDWHSPADIIAASRYALDGIIHLDPASCPEANLRVGAIHFFTKEMNGLEYPWWGNVFVNPPYSSELLSQFIDKTVREHKSGNTEASVTVTNLQSFVFSTGQLLQKHAKLHAVMPGRPRFNPPNRINPKTGKKISFGSPNHGTVCSYFGDKPNLFQEAFEALGSFVCKSLPKRKNTELARKLIRIREGLEIDRNRK